MKTPARNFSRLELCRSRKAIELGIDNEAGHEFNTPLSWTLAGLGRLRAFLGFPITITSGFRSKALNDATGGAKDSQHMKGEAVDFTCPAFGTPEEIVNALAPAVEILGIDQLIVEPGWVHISFTSSPRFEILRMKAGRYSVWKPIGDPKDPLKA